MRHHLTGARCALIDIRVYGADQLVNSF